MDSKLRRTIILLIVFALVPVFILVILANINRQQNDTGKTTVSASTEETVVLVDADNSKSTVSFEKVGNDTAHWKQDETFFDNETDSLAQRILDEMNTLSIRAYSSERDLRVQVTDYQGNIKTGEQFFVSAQNITTGETSVLSDDDYDGVICFVNLTPGDYNVTLKPTGTYNVPDKPEKITVKDSVEYTLIEDISLKMYNESDVDCEKEDTMILTASLDADKKLSNSYGQNTDVIYGVDISSLNGEINWDEVYRSGIRFVMLRAAYRGSESGKIIIDRSFYDNAKGATFAGLRVGAYFYSQAVSELEAVEEASALMTLAAEFRLDYPLTIRFDMAGGSGRADENTEEIRTKVANAFCETIRNSGKEPCIYATKNWLSTNIDYNQLKKNKLWLADFHEPPQYDGYYDIWQYSNIGRVNGIQGEANLNISYIK